MLELKTNVAEEVNENQFKFMTDNFKGLIAWRKEEGKFFVKLMVPKYRTELLKIMS